MHSITLKSRVISYPVIGVGVGVGVGVEFVLVLAFPKSKLESVIIIYGLALNDVNLIFPKRELNPQSLEYESLI